MSLSSKLQRCISGSVHLYSTPQHTAQHSAALKVGRAGSSRRSTGANPDCATNTALYLATMEDGEVCVFLESFHGDAFSGY